MKDKIWNKGKYWDTDEYNKRLSEENKVLDDIDKRRHQLDDEEERKIKEIWKD